MEELPNSKCQFNITKAFLAGSISQNAPTLPAYIQSNIMKKEEETTNTERCVAPGNVEDRLCHAARRPCRPDDRPQAGTRPKRPRTALHPPRFRRDPRGP